MPRQRLLEGLGEIEETPADDDIVVESHEEAHLQAREASLDTQNQKTKNQLLSYTVPNMICIYSVP